MMSKNFSPLRYPGGKKCLSSFFASIIKLNGICDGVYAEPFAGGAGAALNLLLLEYVHNIVINDADYNIYCFWKTILKQTDKFNKRIKDVKVSLYTWRRQRNILADSKNHTPFEVGFATFFLNRCNMSGIINAGPIGGREQKGRWKIDARFNKEDLIKRIERIAHYSNRIKVYNKDAIDFLTKFSLENCDTNSLIYLDPPYYVQGKNLYLNYYQHADHLVLSEYIKNHLTANWVLSYDNVPEILDFYSDNKHSQYNLRYSANNAKVGMEIMFFSDNLIIPKQGLRVIAG